ncbi:MAG: sensor histidine kinase [Acidimicrobiales bacterium]
MTLRRRVLLGFVLVALALVVSNGALTRAFEGDLYGRTDDQLRDTASRPVFIRSVGSFTEPDRVEPLTDLYIAAAALDGTGLVRLGQAFDDEQSPPAPAPGQIATSAGSPETAQPFTVTSADGTTTWRVLAVEGRLESAVLVVAVDLGPVETTLARVQRIQVWGALLVLAALGAVSWWVLRLGIRPLEAVTATAESITGGDLSRRVELPEPHTEAGRLGVAFNTMLDEIQEAFDEAEASEDRVRRFAADASHELRTPLTSVRGYADLWMAGGLRAPGEVDQAMHRISAEGRRMAQLVDDLLELARLDRERPLQHEGVRLDELADDAVGDAAAAHPDHPITTSLVPTPVVGDGARLRQVVTNLVTNACLHTPPDTSVHVEVRPADGDRSGMAHVIVTDDGPGIAPDHLPHLFERFYRVDPSRGGDATSSGLGLAIVAAVAEAHGGTASVESAPGHGCRVVVEIPVSRADPQSSPS